MSPRIGNHRINCDGYGGPSRRWLESSPSHGPLFFELHIGIYAAAQENQKKSSNQFCSEFTHGHSLRKWFVTKRKDW